MRRKRPKRLTSCVVKATVRSWTIVSMDEAMMSQSIGQVDDIALHRRPTTAFRLEAV